jgi:hypothetical protein
MARSTKDAWLSGPGDLREADVEDVPVKGQSVRVRGLPAAYSNQASSEALKLKTIGLDQVATVDTEVLEVLQFAHGCIDPTFTVDEARTVSQKFGPAFKKIIGKIDELSGVDKEAIADANAKFPTRGAGQAGPDLDDATSAGNGRSDVPVRAGGDAGDERPADDDRETGDVSA